MEEKKKFNPIPLIVTLSVLSLFVIGGVVLFNKFKAYSYQQAYNSLAYDMYDSAVIAEDCGNLIVSVWGNAIWNERDAKTDKYTMEKGIFVDDFNDALDKLYSDEDFSKKVDDLYEKQQDVRQRMKDMTKYPKGFDKAYTSLESAYHSYISFTDLIIKCSGSYNSFSEDFGKLDSELSEKYGALDLYVR